MGRRLRWIGVTCAIALVVGACGAGDSEGSGDRTAGTTSSAPVPSTTTLPRTPDDVTRPTTAAEVARVLTRVEQALRASDYDATRTPPLGWQQQVAYGTLLAHPDWLDAVVAAVPADLQPVVRQTHEAGTALSAPELGHAPATAPTEETQFPDWTIVAPKPPDVLMGFYREAEATFGIPWQYLAAIHFLETKTGRIHGNSVAGAQGPMQFIPSTWAAYGDGGDVNDDRDAILAAGRYLRAAGGPGDMPRALRAYNPSDAYVASVSGYAAVMAADPRAFNGFHGWQVFIATATGDRLLPEGWTRP